MYEFDARRSHDPYYRLYFNIRIVTKTFDIFDI